jgi:hypothetical protein
MWLALQHSKPHGETVQNIRAFNTVVFVPSRYGMGDFPLQRQIMLLMPKKMRPYLVLKLFLTPRYRA